MSYPKKPRYSFWASQIICHFGLGVAIGKLLKLGFPYFEFGLFLLILVTILFVMELKDASRIDKITREKKELLLKIAVQGNNINAEEVNQLQIFMFQGYFSASKLEQVFLAMKFYRYRESSNCKYFNFSSPEILKCAVNPFESCESCKDFEPRD